MQSIMLRLTYIELEDFFNPWHKEVVFSFGRTDVVENVLALESVEKVQYSRSAT